MQKKNPNEQKSREKSLIEVLERTNVSLAELIRVIKQNNDLLEKLCNKGNNNCIIEEYSEKQRMLDTKRTNVVMSLENKGEVFYKQHELRCLVAKHLHELAIPGHIKGFQYLKEGISLAIEEPEILKGLTNVFYPRLARMFETTSKGVERAIRHAIEISFERISDEMLGKYYGGQVNRKPGKLTNAECIFLLKERIEDEIALN